MSWTKSLKKKVHEHYKEVAKKHPAGEGSRFKAVEASAKASGASNPAAVAAAVGRKKYGATKMAKMAAAGRKK